MKKTAKRLLEIVPKRLILPSVILLAAWLLYVVGLKPVFIIAILAVNIVWLPMPKLFQSWLSRLFISILIVFALFQVAATLQLLALPSSGFAMLALLVVALQVILLGVAPPSAGRPKRLITRNDIFGLIVAAFFVLPFTPILIGNQSIERIAQIGSLQAVDGSSHFNVIAKMASAEHFTYPAGSYYPSGFHLATAFFETSTIGYHADLSWEGAAYWFFGQYLFLGIMLGFLLYYLCLRWLEVLRGADKNSATIRFVLALCLGPILALLYLLPFVIEGFLNYYYVAATFFVGLLYLSEVKFKSKELQPQILQDKTTRWALLAFLLLIYGAAASWPLLVIPFVMIAVAFMLPDSLRPREIIRAWWRKENILIFLAILLQFVPIYFHLRYVVVDHSVNLGGTLQQFHPYVLLLGLVLVMAIWFGARANAASKKLFTHIFLPFYIFTIIMAFWQYFTLGEVRYYVIKTSLLLEILTLVLGVSCLIYAAMERLGKTGLKYLLVLPLIPFAGMLLLISSVDNPLKDARDLFRNPSNTEKPQFLDQDNQLFIDLGKSGEIKNANTVLLHYDAEKDKFFSHMQVAQWANILQYKPTSEEGGVGGACFTRMYVNITTGSFTDEEQQQLVDNVKKCATIARDQGMGYYIITDPESAPVIRKNFGDYATIIDK